LDFGVYAPRPRSDAEHRGRIAVLVEARSAFTTFKAQTFSVNIEVDLELEVEL
jgi:hypothetical protein